jgi:hypothetical protein
MFLLLLMQLKTVLSQWLADQKLESLVEQLFTKGFFRVWLTDVEKDQLQQRLTQNQDCGRFQILPIHEQLKYGCFTYAWSIYSGYHTVPKVICADFHCPKLGQLLSIWPQTSHHVINYPTLPCSSIVPHSIPLNAVLAFFIDGKVIISSCPS